MDYRRKIELIKMLYGKEAPVGSQVICEQLGITSRTLRNDLRSSADEFERNGFAVKSVHAVGYYLSVTDEDAYARFIQELSNRQTSDQMLVPVYPDDRADYLVRLFLAADDYLKMDDVADSLFVSRATLTNDLKTVRERLGYFQLSLETRPGSGMRIEGSELHRRSAISQYFFQTDSNDQVRLNAFAGGKEDQPVIAEILYQAILEENFRLTDLGFQNLVIHLAIALMRLRQATARADQPFDQSICDTREYAIAEKVCSRLEERFDVIFPPCERAFVAMHLSGKQAMQYQQLSVSYEKLIDGVLSEIAAAFGMDFTFDMSLRTALSLHLEPMMARLAYDMIVQNPLLDHVKTENPLAFEMGVVLARHVRQTYGYEMSDAEIGFVALHFALAVERYRAKGSKKNVIVICASGLGSSQILMYKIKSRFGAYIESILTAQLYDLQHVNQDAYDFILSTVPIPFKTKIPAINIQYFLDDADLDRVESVVLGDRGSAGPDDAFVQRFFHENELYCDLRARDRLSVIHEMVTRLQKTRALPASFEELVLEREHFAATEFGNEVALPHPMRAVTDETFVAVAVLNKPIRWDRKRVRFVFLLSVSTSEQETFGLLHEALSALVFDGAALERFARKPTLATLKTELSRLAEWEADNDLDALFS